METNNGPGILPIILLQCFYPCFFLLEQAPLLIFTNNPNGMEPTTLVGKNNPVQNLTAHIEDINGKNIRKLKKFDIKTSKDMRKSIDSLNF